MYLIELLNTAYLLLHARLGKSDGETDDHGELILCHIDFQLATVTELSHIELPFFVTAFFTALPVKEENEFNEDIIEASNCSEAANSTSGHLIMLEEREDVLAVKYTLTDNSTNLVMNIDEDATRFNMTLDTKCYNFTKFKEDKFYSFKYPINYELDASNLWVYDLQLEKLDAMNLRLPDELPSVKEVRKLFTIFIE
jgi:hypothetical protein